MHSCSVYCLVVFSNIVTRSCIIVHVVLVYLTIYCVFFRGQVWTDGDGGDGKGSFDEN